MPPRLGDRVAGLALLPLAPFVPDRRVLVADARRERVAPVPVEEGADATPTARDASRTWTTGPW